MLILGQVSLGVALIAALAAVGAFLWGRSLGEKNGAGVSKFGYWATFAGAGALTVSVLVMLIAMFSKDFTFMYVAENHSTDVSGLSWLYQLSGLWAGREGSLMFWAWLLALFASWIAYRELDKRDDLANMGLMVTNFILFLFAFGMMFSEPNMPFKASPAEWLGPNGELLTAAGMNPLLQHWAMILHPPTLFIGYAGLTIPFAFAIAAMIVNDGSKRWVEMVDRVTIFSWLLLGAGIGLGSVWAYVVLGWGGYWAWDPVENASLLPWLTGVGLIHSFTVYRKRNAFKRWAVMMSAFTFALVILGTFITRSGVVQSVHGFAPDNLSLWLFLFMILGSVIAAGIGLYLRWETFAGDDEFESLSSKEAAYYFNNVLMLVAGLLVAYMTVSSALPSWMPYGGQSIGATAYDLLARPVGILYILILAVCPILSWRKTGAALFWQRIKWPLVGGAVIFGLLLAEWWLTLKPIYEATIANGGEGARKLATWGPSVVYQGIAVVALFAASLLIATTTALFIDGARKRAAARDENFFAALWHIMTTARSQSGGYLAHIGMGIILIGLVGSSMFVLDNRIQLEDKPGASFKVSNYTFTYQGIQDTTLANGDTNSVATFEVSKDGKPIGVVTPGLTQFARQQQTKLNARVLAEPLRDLFVVWEGNQDNKLSMNVKINPLIGFAWGGFALLLLGTALAAWPKKRPALAAAPAAGAKAKTGKR